MREFQRYNRNKEEEEFGCQLRTAQNTIIGCICISADDNTVFGCEENE